MLYRGSCHCGNIAFEIDGEVEAAVACNCSLCARKGALLWSAPWSRLRLLTTGSDIGTYTFNNRAIAHRFCRSCGIHPYAEDVAEGPDRSVYVNLRCVQNIDLASVPVVEFDGRAL